MSPNPQFKLDSESISMDDINSKMMNGEDSSVNAAAEKPIKPETETPSKEAQPGDDNFDKFLNLMGKGGQSPGEPTKAAAAEPPATEEGQVGQDVDDGFIGLVAAWPYEPCEGENAQNSAEPSAESEAKEGSEENEFVVSPIERRRSSGLRVELQSNDLLNSVKTTDSWGGKEGSLPPLPVSAKLGNDDDVSDLDDDDSSAGPAGPSSSPEDKNHPAQRSNSLPTPGLDKDADNVANYVNFNKLLQPGSSKYYYSQANHSNRQLLEKVKSKRKTGQNLLLDDSVHSKVSILSDISRSSSYRGPTPLKKDGQVPKSIIKVKRADSSGSVSVDSKGMRRCVFSSVDIREHERVAGDNPCVSSGVPLSLGWGHYQHDSILLDDYELNKGPSRDKIEMMVPPGVRKEMLRDGFSVSISDMNAAIREVNITKRQRRHTVGTEHLEGWTEAAQSAKRKLGRFMKRTSTAKEQEKVWLQAQNSA